MGLAQEASDAPGNASRVKALLSTIGPDSWLWRVPADLSVSLDNELASAKWWAKDLAHYDAHNPGEGMVGAVLSLKQHLLAVVGELKRLRVS
jgi:hypothetical protein